MGLPHHTKDSCSGQTARLVSWEPLYKIVYLHEPNMRLLAYFLNILLHIFKRVLVKYSNSTFLLCHRKNQ